MDWTLMRGVKEKLNEAILPFDELAALVGGIDSYIQFKPDQKEPLGAAVEKLKRQRQSAMNIVTLGSMVNTNIKECILSKKEIDNIARAFLFHKTLSDNVEWGERLIGISQHMVDMNKCFKDAVRALMEEELKDEEEEGIIDDI